MRISRVIDHLILITGCLLMVLPVLMLVLSSTHSSAVIDQQGLQLSIGTALLEPYHKILVTEDMFGNGVDALDMLINSFIVATAIAVVKTMLSLLAAYALVYFRLPGATFIFAVILISMFLPVETRILPTFLVTSDLGLLNSYTGMTLPIVASGLGTLVFRQYLQQVPEELTEAARIDGAGPVRFFFDILLPVSVPMIMALFLILFVIGWKQYLWPLVINTTSEEHYTIVRGIQRAGTASNTGMALAVLALLPPAIIMFAAQRWIVRGLTEAWR